MIDFRKTKFIISCTSRANTPNDGMQEVVVIGKSNVGKSSLINAICENRSLAFTSSKPGHTRLLNYFNVDNKFYLVDAPGYGYSAAGKQHTVLFGEMMEDFFNKKEHLSLVVYLLDSRHKATQDDIDFYDFLVETKIPFIVVMTKCDKLNQKEKSQMIKNIQESFPDFDKTHMCFASINNLTSLVEVKKLISNYIK